MRYTALNGTSSSAQSRQPPEPESSIRVPGRLPVTRMHRDSSRCLARALPVAPPVCDTTAAAAAAARMAPGAGRPSVSHGPPESPPGRVAPSRSESGSPPLAPSAASDSGCPVRLRVARRGGPGQENLNPGGHRDCQCDSLALSLRRRDGLSEPGPTGLARRRSEVTVPLAGQPGHRRDARYVESDSTARELESRGSRVLLGPGRAFGRRRGRRRGQSPRALPVPVEPERVTLIRVRLGLGAAWKPACHGGPPAVHWQCQ